MGRQKKAFWVLAFLSLLCSLILWEVSAILSHSYGLDNVSLNIEYCNIKLLIKKLFPINYHLSSVCSQQEQKLFSTRKREKTEMEIQLTGNALKWKANKNVYSFKIIEYLPSKHIVWHQQHASRIIKNRKWNRNI